MRALASRLIARVIGAGTDAWKGWRTFWFRPADPLPLGVIRLLIGGMLFYTHLVWGLRLDAFFGDGGWQPPGLIHSIQSSPFTWSFWWLVPAALRSTVHVACLVVLALFLLGAFTRINSILAYAIVISYAHRAPLANFGLDQFNAIATLYLAIGPSGATLSIDRLRARYRAARRDLALGCPFTPTPVLPTPRANLSLRLIQVHLCVIYVFASLSKLQGESWWNGEAIWQAASNLEYQSGDLTWLAWYPWLVNLLTHITMIWELTFWSLIWKPFFRPIVLLVGAAIHLGIGAFMGMWTFGLAAIFTYSAFITGAEFRILFRQLARPLTFVLKRLQQTRAIVQRPRILAWTTALVTVGDQPPPAIEPHVEPVSVGAAQEQSGPARSTVEEPSPSRSAEMPTVLLVEKRNKRQAAVQDYLTRRGFRCLLAADVQQARGILAVSDVQAIVVTSLSRRDDEFAEFRQALIAGSSELPATVFLRKAKSGALRPWDEAPRHRLLYGSITLRELRVTLEQALGRADPLPAQGQSAPLPEANEKSSSDEVRPAEAPPAVETNLDPPATDDSILIEHGTRT